MFGLFRGPGPESVHFIDMREGKISFLLQRPKSPGVTMKVRFPLIPAAQTTRLDVAVTVTACRPAPAGAGHICVAEPQLSPSDTVKLAETLSLYCISGAREIGQVRQTDRSRISLRVLGRQIPYYRAVASDLSPGGIKLHCQGELEIGTVVDLNMEMDVPGMKDFLVRSRVAWTLCDETKTQCTAGMQFLDLDRRRQIQLQRYLEAVADRGIGPVTHQLSRE
jgi:hypothetical protein